MKQLVFGLLTASAAAVAIPSPSHAQQVPVYRGVVKYPDFAFRDKAYAYLRTRIIEEMRTGPNFAGRYAILQLGCGTGCSSVLVADVSTGRVYDFPYGGEIYQMMTLTYDVKSNFITAKWVNEQNKCMADDMMWTGSRFVSQNRRVIGNRSRCVE